MYVDCVAKATVIPKTSGLYSALSIIKHAGTRCTYQAEGSDENGANALKVVDHAVDLVHWASTVHECASKPFLSLSMQSSVSM